jgi:hypothetical protein
MPSNPSRLTDLKHPDAVSIINKTFDSYAKRLDDIAKAASSKRIASESTLVFGTIPANSSKDSIVNILLASTTLVAHANPILPLDSGGQLTWSAFVSKNGQVTVRVSNPTTAPIVVNTVRWNILVA